MASLATVSNFPDTVNGSNRVCWRDVTFSNSYATGGEALTPAQVGMANIVEVHPQQGKLGLLYCYDFTNLKLQAFYPTGGATASPAALANPQVSSGASTASAVSATTPALTPGQGKEVGSTTDLSTVTIRVRFVGR